MDIVLGPAGENVSCNCLPTVYRLFTAAKHAWSTVQVGKGTGGFFLFGFLFLEMLSFFLFIYF